MGFVLAERVRETTLTTGTGTVDLAGATLAMRTFVAGIGTGNTTRYCITSGDGVNWEIGTGTVTDGSPDTLTRSPEISTNANAAISLEYEIGATDGDLRYWRAKEAMRQAELLLASQADARRAFDARITALLGWIVAGTSLLIAASVGTPAARAVPALAAMLPLLGTQRRAEHPRSPFSRALTRVPTDSHCGRATTFGLGSRESKLTRSITLVQPTPNF